MNYRADQLGAPIRGYRVGSQKLLVKVVKKRRRLREAGQSRGEGSSSANRVEADQRTGQSGEAIGSDSSGKGKGKDAGGGVFTTEVVGAVTQTVRFRCEFELPSSVARAR
jgi:general transcription factor 3C polypeptide 5 (transcription factor C subunit 1)